MLTDFQQWCMENFGWLPRTMTEIVYLHRWYQRDQAAAAEARAVLDAVRTVDDLLAIGGH